MKKARMNISHSRFILFKLKIFGEIVTTKLKSENHSSVLILSAFFSVLNFTSEIWRMESSLWQHCSECVWSKLQKRPPKQSFTV